MTDTLKDEKQRGEHENKTEFMTKLYDTQTQYDEKQRGEHENKTEFMTKLYDTHTADLRFICDEFTGYCFNTSGHSISVKFSDFVPCELVTLATAPFRDSGKMRRKKKYFGRAV